MRSRTLTAFAGLCWLLLIVLGLSTFALAQQYGGTIVEANEAEPSTLDITQAVRLPEIIILNLIHETLFVMDKNVQPEPLLVDSWESSEDARNWTLRIKQGITFHDGTPLDADAVKYNLERHLTGSHAFMLGPLQKVETPDEFTVSLEFAEPFPLLITYLANCWLGLISPSAAMQYGEDYGTKAAVGTGPFEFVEWISGDRVVLKRNESYTHGPSFASNKGPAYVENWIFRFIPETSTLVWELTDGEVDISTYVPASSFEEVSNDPGTAVYTKVAPTSFHIAINNSKPPFTDRRVREAAAHAIDRQTVVKAGMFGVGEAIPSLVPTSVIGYWKGADYLGEEYTYYSPRRAAELLDEAEWVDANGDGIREKEGSELEIDLFTFRQVRHVRVAEVAGSMLEAVGFKVNILIAETGDMYDRITRGEHNLLSTGYAGVSMAQDMLFPLLHSDNLGTLVAWFVYDNKELDELLERSLTEVDSTERTHLLNRAQELIIRDAVNIPIASPLDTFVYDEERIGGVDKYMEHPWAFTRLELLKGLELFVKD